MLRYAAGIVCLLGSLALLYAGLRTPPKPPVPPAPDFTLDTPVKDFGEVDQFSELPATFTLTNTHPEPVEVLSVMKSCACASAEVTPKVIPPGGTGTLTTVWKVGKNKGKTATALAVHYKVGGKPQQLLIGQMTADVRPLVACDPDKLVFDRAAKETREVKLTTRTPEPVKLLRGWASEPWLTVDCDPQTGTVRVTCDPTLCPQTGPLTCRVIVYTDSVTHPEVLIEVAVRK